MPSASERATSPQKKDFALRGVRHTHPLPGKPELDSMDGAQALVRCLEEQGVEYIFGSPAGRRSRFSTRWSRPTPRSS